MAIKLTVSPLVKFKVKGTIKDESGADQPFDFSLICERRNTDEIAGLLRDKSDQSLTEFMVGVIRDWDGVRDEENKPIPYSKEELEKLFLIPGVGAIAFRTYFEESGAKAKN